MKTALVTGADRGFGFCITKEFLRLGYTVFAGKFLEDYFLLESLADEYPDSLIIVNLDVESRQSILDASSKLANYTQHLDVFVSNAAFMGGPAKLGEPTPKPETYNPPDLKDNMLDIELTEKSVRVNALGALQCTEILLPLMEKGQLKRLCYVSSEVASVNQMQRNSNFRYPMSKSALNMAVRMLHNTLYPKGYTFRLYHPGGMRRMLPDGTDRQGNPDSITAAFSAEKAIKFFTENRPDEHRLLMVDYLGFIWPC
jgi:NAD(P)-dependent dehydrogenase (short-subunit alcohol dehydrogenase family)